MSCGMQNNRKDRPKWLPYVLAGAAILLVAVLVLLLVLMGRRGKTPELPSGTAPSESTPSHTEPTKGEVQVQTLQDVVLPAPVFPQEPKTEVMYDVKPEMLFADKVSGAYRVECDDPSVQITESEGVFRLLLTDFNDKKVTVTRTAEDGEESVVCFLLKLTPQIETQLCGGNFENGYLGWQLTKEEKEAYIVYDSPVDIWNNPVNATNHYLYGFANEKFVGAEIHSSLFRLDGTGVITWKMAGNCTQDLLFVLMQYNEDGEDEEIARFNNWYYTGSNESGFIFREYYYRVDMDKYAGSTCYFIVRDDNDGADGFGFVNLDDIVTYYAEVPDVDGMMSGGFCENPHKAVTTAPSVPTVTDTSNIPFPSDLSDVPNQLFNGNFESGRDGWYMDVAEKTAYAIYDSPVDIWGNPVGATGRYLYGYANEAYAAADFHSGLFKAAGSGYITWKMAGNCTEELQFILMRYNPDGQDEEIARFNNWYFGTAAESGFIFHDYYYQLDMSKYAGSYCYFRVVDKDTGSGGFGFVNLDDIVTYYETAPNVDGMLEGAYCKAPEEEKPDDPFETDLTKVPYQLVNGDFENGYENWHLTTQEKLAYAICDSPVDIWGNPVGASEHYLYGYANEAFANANFYSGLFKVGGSGMLTWKMAGNCTEQLQFILMRYNPEGMDEEVARFNNWYFGTTAESGFIFHDYCYQIDMSKYADSYCYFVVKDTMSENFAFICLDDIVTYYETAPDVSAYLPAGYCTKPETPPVVDPIVDPDEKAFGSDVSGITCQLVNGNFENGYENWYLNEEEKAAYTIYDSPTDIWGNPVGATGHYLYGFANEAFANANFYSGLFKVGGSGMLTWKMAGNCTDQLQFVLMRYNPEGLDEEIARFNNWYFGTTAESGFIFHDYYYQLDMSKYADSYCYFVVKDTMSENFAFICLDDIVTYYETAPDVSAYLPAGYCAKPETPPVVDPIVDPDEKAFGSDVSGVTCQLVNGDFENGYENWYLSEEEKAAYTIYDSPTDIWGNLVGATGRYLYGFANEAFANANFYSGLFKVGGSGMLTWKMAGNCTDQLQFILMRYNPEGLDEEIARFNNWYFGTTAESGFIFHDYYYQIDMSEYADSYCYFVVKDTMSENFAFICLDDIVTYYETAPDVSAMQKGGFCTRPEN